MKKNGKKDVVSGNREEFEHFTKILMEKMDSNIKTVTEQYGGIAKQMSEIKNDVKELKDGMTIVRPVVERNSRDIQEIKKDMREVKSELHSMNMALIETSHEIKDHEKRIKRVEEKVLI